MSDDLRQQVVALQHSVCQSAKPWLSEPELNDLRGLIRLTVEFHDWLQSTDIDIWHRPEVQYIAESTVSGIDSFYNVAAAYRALVGAGMSRVQWDTMSLQSLREQFLPIFDEIVREGHFEPRCRAILDLFKIQIVIAGVLYE
jgi:hypothetical protein